MSATCPECWQEILGDAKKMFLSLSNTSSVPQRSRDKWISSILLTRFAFLNKRMETNRNQWGKVDIAKNHAAIYIIRNIVIRLLFLVTLVQIGKCVLFNFVLMTFYCQKLCLACKTNFKWNAPDEIVVTSFHRFYPFQHDKMRHDFLAENETSASNQCIRMCSKS